MAHTMTAIVPMRHRSERVPGKNHRTFVDRPLYHHVIETLLRARGVDRVVIDTDSPTIMDDAAKRFADVTVLERPERLRGGETPMNDVLLSTCDRVESDFYLQTHATNPLLRPETVDEAIERFHAAYPVQDSLFAVTRVQARLWDQIARPINHNAAMLLRTQDLPPVYLENSCLYVFTRDRLAARHNRIGERPIMFEMDPLEATDIDEEIDFHVGEALHRIYHAEGGAGGG